MITNLIVDLLNIFIKLALKRICEVMVKTWIHRIYQTKMLELKIWNFGNLDILTIRTYEDDHEVNWKYIDKNFQVDIRHFKDCILKSDYNLDDKTVLSLCLHYERFKKVFGVYSVFHGHSDHWNCLQTLLPNRIAYKTQYSRLFRY